MSLILDSQKIILDTVLSNIVSKHCGNNAELVNWKIVDFTKKGDNYVSYVTSIETDVSNFGTNETITFILKVNPSRELEAWKMPTPVLFKHETELLSNLLPSLSEQYTSSDPIKHPKCFYSSPEEKQEFLILNDVRKDGFKIVPKNIPLDDAHVKLVFHELAKLHASGYISLKNMKKFKEKFPRICEGNFSNKSCEPLLNFLSSVIKNQLHMSILVLENTSGNQEVHEFLKKFTDIVALKETILESTRDRPGDIFNTVTHGDCWSNNIMFRYEDDSKPIAAMLLDFQMSRITSISADINYFLYTSTDGQFRKRSLESNLKYYYETFKNVLELSGEQIPFTYEELNFDIKLKSPYGFIFGLFIVPFSTAENVDDEPDVISKKDDELEDYLKEFYSERIPIYLENQNFIQRFNEIVQDIQDYLAFMEKLKIENNI